MSETPHGEVPERLPLGPGPSPLHPRVQAALARPVLGHMDPDFLDILDDVADLLREVFRTEGLAFAVSGSGSAGMEAALVNLLERGDTAIVGVAGFFAERMAEITRRTGADLVRVEAPWGRPVAPEDVERALGEHPDAKVVALVHAETSTGVWQPLEEVGAMCRERPDTYYVVDTVASLGGIPVDVDALGIDVCFSGSQKCLSVPPGLAPICFSAKALTAVENRETPVQSWYFDVTGIREYVGTHRRYHHTAPINMIFGLLEGLRIVMDEGLEARWRRHEEVGRVFQARMVERGFEMFAAEDVRLPHITAMLLPDGVDDKDARKRLIEEHGIEIAGGLGAYAGRMWRVGLMGEGARPEIAERLLEAVTAVTS